MKEKENTMCGWRQMAEEGEDEGRGGEVAGDKGSGRFFFLLREGDGEETG